ncbi:hypothetical protein [Mycobacterium sp. OTB74]|uniref:hypothetical protein n=1 Tax=Mycobacterium sp. OTB74 TaxID=1853452 RepID=UPI002472F57D|nr:hypothetical protein [Mycobacterium sp. OTB74]MDH6242545.1 hypothetical protein [Mycobacterium sp. OTB74]
MATTFRVAGRVMKCPVGKLKFETVSTVSTAVALAVTTLVAGSGDALVVGHDHPKVLRSGAVPGESPFREALFRV